MGRQTTISLMLVLDRSESMQRGPLARRIRLGRPCSRRSGHLPESRVATLASACSSVPSLCAGRSVRWRCGRAGGLRRRRCAAPPSRRAASSAVRPRDSASSTASTSSPRASNLRARASSAVRQSSAWAWSGWISGTVARWSSQCAKLCTPGVDDGLGLRHRRLPLARGLHHVGQVVDGVEVDVGQLRHLGLDVARHGQIDHEHRAAPRAFSARSTAPRPMIGNVLAVQLTITSNSCRRAGRSASGIVWAPKRPASCSPRSSVRLATAMLRRLRGEVGGRQFDHLAGADEQHAARCPGPRTAGRRSRTAAAAMLTEWAPISVELRTSLATAKERWNSWSRVVPSARPVRPRAPRPSSGRGSGPRPAPWNRARWRPGRRGGPPAVRSSVGVAAQQRRRTTPPNWASQSRVGLDRVPGRRSRSRCGCRWRGSPPPAGAPRRQSRRRALSVGPTWSMANAKRPRISSGAVVWLMPKPRLPCGGL